MIRSATSFSATSSCVHLREGHSTNKDLKKQRCLHSTVPLPAKSVTHSSTGPELRTFERLCPRRSRCVHRQRRLTIRALAPMSSECDFSKISLISAEELFSRQSVPSLPSPCIDSPHERRHDLLVFFPGMDCTVQGLLKQVPHILSAGYDLRSLFVPSDDRSSWPQLVDAVVKLLEDAARGSKPASRNASRASRSKDSAHPTARRYRSVTLLAESFGACLALRVAVAAPHLVSRLVLVNPATSFSRSNPLISFGAATGLLEHFPPGLFGLVQDLASSILVKRSSQDQEMLKLLSAERGSSSSSSSKGMGTGLLSSVRPRNTGAVLDGRAAKHLSSLSPVYSIPAACASWRCLLLSDSSGLEDRRLRRIRIPTLLVASAKDRLLPSVTECVRLKALFPDSKTAILPSSGHTPLLEDGVDITLVMRLHGFTTGGLVAPPLAPNQPPPTPALAPAQGGSTLPPPAALAFQGLEAEMGVHTHPLQLVSGRSITVQGPEPFVVMEPQAGVGLLELEGGAWTTGAAAAAAIDELLVGEPKRLAGSNSSSTSSSRMDAAVTQQLPAYGGAVAQWGTRRGSEPSHLVTGVERLGTPDDNGAAERVLVAAVSMSAAGGSRADRQSGPVPGQTGRGREDAASAGGQANSLANSPLSGPGRTGTNGAVPLPSSSDRLATPTDSNGFATTSDSLPSPTGKAGNGYASPSIGPSGWPRNPTQTEPRRSSQETDESGAQISSRRGVGESFFPGPHQHGVPEAATHRQQGRIKDLPPDEVYDEFRRILEPWRVLTSPLVVGDENLVAVREELGRTGAGARRGVLFVGNHTLFGVYDTPLLLLELFLRGFRCRGLAHPAHWLSGLGPVFERYGHVPLSPRTAYQLLENGDSVLLFPGGSREVNKRRGEAYRLQWGEHPEFVRLAARLDAIIVPFALVGADEAYDVMWDTSDILSAPLIGPLIRDTYSRYNLSPDSDVSPICRLPGTPFPSALPLPSSIERVYIKFCEPLDTASLGKAGRGAALWSEAYRAVRSRVEGGISDLRKVQAADPEREVGPRLMRKLSRLLPEW